MGCDYEIFKGFSAKDLCLCFMVKFVVEIWICLISRPHFVVKFYMPFKNQHSYKGGYVSKASIKFRSMCWEVGLLGYMRWICYRNRSKENFHGSSKLFATLSKFGSMKEFMVG